MGTLSVDKILKTSQGAAEFTLPATDGAAGTVWQTDGSGQLSVATVGSSGIAAGAVGTSEIAANAVTLAEMAGLARGSIIYGNASGDPTALTKGTADQVLTSDGTDVSWAAAAGGGKVLQVLTVTDATSITTSSTSFVTTGISLTITPAATTSKIFIMLQGGGAYPNSTASVTMRTTVYRDSTDLGHTTVGMTRHSTVGGAWAISPHSIAHLDSPSTTSATVYTVYFKNADTAGTVQFNGTDRGLLSFTLMEIGA